MKINRKELLHRLLCVEPGISKNDIAQSSCVTVTSGRFYTLGMEIACSITSNLPKEWEGCIPAEKLYKTMKELPDEEIDVDMGDGIFRIKGKSFRVAKIAMEGEMLSPIDEVELPDKDSWTDLHEEFSDAIKVTNECTKKKDEGSIRECVHITRNWIEACDDSRLARYTIPTFVKKSSLVRGRTIKEMVQLGMTKGAETDNWLHFRNPTGLRLSIKKYDVVSYPDMTEFLNKRGRRIVFSKSLSRVVKTAGVFANERIQITVNKDKMTVLGSSVEGEYSEGCKVVFTGNETTFSIPSEIMALAAEKSGRWELTDSGLRMDGGRFVMVTALMMEGADDSNANH